MLLYVAGPYRGDVKTNIENARKVAIALWEMGHTAICPHLNTAHFENDCRCHDDDYIERDLIILQRCDAAVFIDGWHLSQGALIEHQFCLQNNIPAYLWQLDEHREDLHQLTASRRHEEPITRDEVLGLIRKHETAAALVSAIAFPIVLLSGIVIGWAI